MFDILLIFIIYKILTTLHKHLTNYLMETITKNYLRSEELIAYKGFRVLIKYDEESSEPTLIIPYSFPDSPDDVTDLFDLAMNTLSSSLSHFSQLMSEYSKKIGKHRVPLLNDIFGDIYTEVSTKVNENGESVITEKVVNNRAQFITTSDGAKLWSLLQHPTGLTIVDCNNKKICKFFTANKNAGKDNKPLFDNFALSNTLAIFKELLIIVQKLLTSDKIAQNWKTFTLREYCNDLTTYLQSEKVFRREQHQSVLTWLTNEFISRFDEPLISFVFSLDKIQDLSNAKLMGQLRSYGFNATLHENIKWYTIVLIDLYEGTDFVKEAINEPNVDLHECAKNGDPWSLGNCNTLQGGHKFAKYLINCGVIATERFKPYVSNIPTIVTLIDVIEDLHLTLQEKEIVSVIKLLSDDLTFDSIIKSQLIEVIDSKKLLSDESTYDMNIKSQIEQIKNRKNDISNETKESDGSKLVSSTLFSKENRLVPKSSDFESTESIIIEQQRKMIEVIKEELYKHAIDESQKKEIANNEKELYEYIISEVQSKCNNFQSDIESELVENMRQLQKDMIQLQKKIINNLKELLIKYDSESCKTNKSLADSGPIMKIEMKI